MQMLVHEDTRKYLVVVTNKGYFRYKKLFFGVSFAPALFQSTTDQMIAGIESSVSYLDDTLISARTLEEHCSRFNRILERLRSCRF